MKILWNGEMIADDADLNRPISNKAVDGFQIVQDAQFARAAQAAVWARGNRMRSFSFRVPQGEESLRAAQVAFFTGYNDVPDEGTLQIICGEGEELSTVQMENAVLTQQSESDNRGVSWFTTYQFRGPAFEVIEGFGLIFDGRDYESEIIQIADAGHYIDKRQLLTLHDGGGY